MHVRSLHNVQTQYCALAEKINDSSLHLFVPTQETVEGAINPRNQEDLVQCFFFDSAGQLEVSEIDESIPGHLDKAIQLFSKPGSAKAQEALNHYIAIDERNLIKNAIDQGAMINCPTIIKGKWESCLHSAFWAAYNCQFELMHLRMLQTLIDLGANVNDPGPEGWTPLIALCWGQKFYLKGSVESLQMLIDAGADVNAKNSFGNTALMYASKKMTPKRVECLIKAGADVLATNKAGSTALDMALDSDANMDAVHILRSAMAARAINDSIASVPGGDQVIQMPVRRRTSIF